LGVGFSSRYFRGAGELMIIIILIIINNSEVTSNLFFWACRARK
jgi:uncharacterized integral membrane protein